MYSGINAEYMGKAKMAKKTKMSQKKLRVKKMMTKIGGIKQQRAAMEAKQAKSTRYKDLHANVVKDTEVVGNPQIHSSMYLKWNTALGPPYRVLMDTNFISFSLLRKMDPLREMMDCLLAKVFPCVCSCVFAELEKLGSKYRTTLKISKDPRFTRLYCDNHYADDCIVARVTQNPIYIVATCDKELKCRLRKIPGVPIMYIKKHRYAIERLPEAFITDK